MTAEQFFYAVKEMRTAQKNYFKARKKGNGEAANAFLAQSMTYEKNVDVMIMRIQDELRNPSFFLAYARHL